jgi:hypothetical protein
MVFQNMRIYGQHGMEKSTNNSTFLGINYRYQIVALLITVLTFFSGDVFCSGFEHEVLSNDEENSVRLAIENFLKCESVCSKNADDIVKYSKIEGIRFNRYYGKIVDLFSKNLFFRVSLDRDSPNVVSFTDMENRNLLEACESESPIGQDYVHIDEAYDAVLKFLDFVGLNPSDLGLVQKRAELSCLGSEEYFQFIWREHYDEDGIAWMIARVELLINPINSKIFFFKYTFSKSKSYSLSNWKNCHDKVSSSRFSDDEFSFDKMALFLDHSKDGTERPMWAVTLREKDQDGMRERIVFVDAESCEEVSD